MMKKLKKLLAGFLGLAFVFGFVLIPSQGKAAELINEAFNAGLTAPGGWTISVSGLYATDTSAGLAVPALKFGLTGDFFETESFANADSVSFWTKGYAISATSSLLIQGYNGAAWILVSEISDLTNSEKITTLPLDAAITKLKFTYNKDSGNLSFDDLVISGEAASVPTGNSLTGNVGLTITPAIDVAQNVTENQADIVFSLNGGGLAKVLYGETSVYGLETSVINAVTDIESRIILSGLSCGTSYHYKIVAENSANATDVDETPDAIFSTGICSGISIDNLQMTKASAKAKNTFADGWEWQFDLSVADMNETNLQMKFSQWLNQGNAAATIDAGGNMKISVDNGATWTSIDANDVYSAAVDISAIDLNQAAAGRQVSVLVQMKVPISTITGAYGANFGINIQ